MAFLSKAGNILIRQTVSKQIAFDSSVSRPSIYQAVRCMSGSKFFVGGRVILDHETGRSRGFGFTTYTTSEEASSAIQALGVQ